MSSNPNGDTPGAVENKPEVDDASDPAEEEKEASGAKQSTTKCEGGKKPKRSFLKRFKRNK